MGTFLAALVLVPPIGTQRTFIVAAVAVALVAAIGAAPRWAFAVPLGLAALLFDPAGPDPAADDGRACSPSARRPTSTCASSRTDDGERRLILNEGRAVHSVWRRGSYLTDDYWDGYLVLPFASLRRAAPVGRDARQRGRDRRAGLRPLLPGASFDAVEIDGELLAARPAATSGWARTAACASTPRTRARGSRRATRAST